MEGFNSTDTVSVWTVSDGLPGTKIFSENVEFSVIADHHYDGLSVITVGGAVTGLNLGAGTYDISFYNRNLLGVLTYPGGSNLAYWATPYGKSFVGGSIGFALINTPAVPEASTWAMAILGFAGLGFAAFRQGRKTSVGIA
jgi:hypothetical protein